MKTHRKLSARQETASEDRLYRALLTCRTTEDCRAFLHDLCTPAELQAMKDRWAVAELLDDGLPYRQVHQQTGVSVTTIARVARCLQGHDGGYTRALRRMGR